MAARRHRSGTTATSCSTSDRTFPLRRIPAFRTCSPEALDQQYETVQINLNNYWHGYWPHHPVQVHLHGLPEDVIVKVITDFVEESPVTRSAGEELCGLAAVELRSNVRRAFSHAVHAEVPSDYCRQHEHRLAGPTYLPAKLGGGAAWSALAVIPAQSLHHALPLPDGRRIRILFEEVRPAGKSETQSRAGIA